MVWLACSLVPSGQAFNSAQGPKWVLCIWIAAVMLLLHCAPLYEHEWLMGTHTSSTVGTHWVKQLQLNKTSGWLSHNAHSCLPCALQVVHSRTFGTAAKKGGVGVRMLLPLVDMVGGAAVGGSEPGFKLEFRLGVEERHRGARLVAAMMDTFSAAPLGTLAYGLQD